MTISLVFIDTLVNVETFIKLVPKDMVAMADMGKGLLSLRVSQ